MICDLDLRNALSLLRKSCLHFIQLPSFLFCSICALIIELFRLTNISFGLFLTKMACYLIGFNENGREFYLSNTFKLCIFFFKLCRIGLLDRDSGDVTEDLGLDRYSHRFIQEIDRCEFALFTQFTCLYPDDLLML